MPKLIISNTKDQYETEEGDSVMDLCDQHQAIIPFGCRAASCGTCRVRVLKNPAGFLAKEDAEIDFLENFIKGAHADDRLACQCIISGQGDIEIQVVDTGQHLDVPNALKE